jgi:hypothetical protein
MRQFYDIEFNFTRTDEYCGVCTDDGDFLFRIDRMPKPGSAPDMKVISSTQRVTELGIVVNGRTYGSEESLEKHTGEFVNVEVKGPYVYVYELSGNLICRFKRWLNCLS